MRLILLRHGETIWNVDQRLQGHEDAPLSSRGIAQAKGFLSFASAINPKQVVTSDLGRCRHTVALIGHPDAPSDPRLRELHMGEWTGRRKTDLIAENHDEYWAWRAGKHTPRDGEKLCDFQSRIVAGLRDWLQRTNGDLLAVVHSGVIRSALNAFVGLAQDKVIPATPGTAMILNFENAHSNDVRLEAYNLGAFVPQSADAVSD